MNDLEFSAKKRQLIRSRVRRAKYTTAAQVAQCSATCTRSLQPSNIRNKRTSALDGTLDEEQNEIDSEAEDNI